jgi:hypothetical protein
VDKTQQQDKTAPGTEGTLSGYPATLIRHYHEDMYEFRLARGEKCAWIGDFKVGSEA